MRSPSSFASTILITVSVFASGIDDASCLSKVMAQDNPNGKATLPNVADKDAEASEEIVLKGVVLKPDGSPAAGAVVRSAVNVTAALETRLGRKIVSKVHEASADADGQFALSMSRSPFNQLPSEAIWQNLWNATPIVALLKGFGPAHMEIGNVDLGTPITLKLVEDLPIRGQIIDLEGQPVKGTRLTIAEVQMVTNDDPSRLLSSLKGDGGSQAFILAPQFQKQWSMELVERRLIDLPENVITDEKGSFEIHGLGKDRVIHFALDGGDVAWRTIIAISREMEPIQPGTVMRQRVPELVYGSKFQVAVPATRPVEGIVIDAQTEKPLAGVSVEMERPRSNALGRPMALHSGRPLTVMKAVTDEEGRFRLMGMAKTDGNSLLVFPPDEQPYFHEEVDVRDTPGIDPINLTIKLHRGIWITGRIIDKATKEPVVGARVHYYPFRKNEFAAKVPVFKRGGAVMESDLNRFKTASDGAYRLIGLPGPAILTANSDSQAYRTGMGLDQMSVGKEALGGQLFNSFPMSTERFARKYNILQEINPSADETDVRVDLELESGISITVQFVDSEGAVVKNVMAWGPGVRPAATGPRSPVNRLEGFQNGMITVENLGPDDRPVLHAYHFERNLGLKFQLQPPYENGREIKFVLEPMAIVTGRLFEEGAPMRRVSIGRTYRDVDAMVSVAMPPPIATDDEGRFRCPLIPGHEYRLVAQGRSFGPGSGRIIAEKLNVKAGETIDVGDVEFIDDRFRPVKTEK